jgi:hypothetical protein
MFSILAGVTGGFAQEISWDSSVDWQQGALRITAETPIDRSGANAPAAAHRAEQEIEARLPAELVSALMPLRIDSRETLAGELRRDPSLYEGLATLAEDVRRLVTRPDPSLSRLSVTYRLDLFPGVPRLLLRDDLPLPFRKILGWVPSDSYTGVVIYAADPLPLHGTDLTTTIEPALFPEIYDEQMGDVLTRDQLDAEWVERWGAAAYTDSMDLSPFVERIGNNPKRVLARRLFGVSPTDVVISSEDARELLVNETNRRLLREGRILIVTPTN